jgi:DNA-binding FrmR family transcriptional regulator
MSDKSDKKEVLLRLKKIEGQVRGLQRMVEEENPCADILTQVAAVTAAMKKVGRVIVQAYMSECLEKDRNTSQRKEGSLKDLQAAIARYIDWA